MTLFAIIKTSIVHYSGKPVIQNRHLESARKKRNLKLPPRQVDASRGYWAESRPNSCLSGFAACVLSLVFTVSILTPLKLVSARDFKVGTGLNVGYEWYERIYENESGADQTNPNEIVTTTQDLTSLPNERYSGLRISPLIDIESLTARDAIHLQYSPSFRYDIDTYEHDIDHKLIASLSRYLTKNWRMSLTENFVLSDLAEEDTAEELIDTNELLDDIGRRQYLTNDISFVTSYTYWEDSSLSFRYSYTILQDIDDDDDSRSYENYDRHGFLLSAEHRFDSTWRMFFNSGYVRGLYDEVESQSGEDNATESDLEEFRVSTALHANLLKYHPLSLAYSFYGVDYDDVDLNSSMINDFTLGWQWNYSKDVTISLGGGPSYTKTMGQDADWGYNANFGLQYSFENGNLDLSGQRGYERQNFSGTDENGLQEYWQARMDVSYRLLEDLTLNAYASYRYEDQEIITDSFLAADDDSDPVFELSVFNKETSRVGATVIYFFEQWYSLSISYNFIHQDSERVNDSYDEHRFLLTLGFKKDILKW